MTRLKKGDPAPDISLPAIDGSTFELSSMKGRRVILTFFRFLSLIHISEPTRPY